MNVLVLDVLEILFLKPAVHILGIVGAGTVGGQKGIGGRLRVAHCGAMHRSGDVHLAELDPAAGLDQLLAGVTNNFARRGLLRASEDSEALTHKTTSSVQLITPRLGDVMDGASCVGRSCR